MELILDTNFIIAIERESRRNLQAEAHEFLKTHFDKNLWINFTIAGELACGDSMATHSEWEHLCRPFPILPWSKEISWHYGTLYRHLKGQGNLIGTNDLWIAATAITHGMGVVTRNQKEFQKIKNLEIVTF